MITKTKLNFFSRTWTNIISSRFNCASRRIHLPICWSFKRILIIFLRVADETQQAENWKILVNIVRCLIFLAEQNISFRDDDDDSILEENNRSQGNFRNLILFRIEAGDSMLKRHLKNCSKNATYLSPSKLSCILYYLLNIEIYIMRE